jgi:hypothetical protein
MLTFLTRQLCVTANTFKNLPLQGLTKPIVICTLTFKSQIWDTHLLGPRLSSTTHTVQRLFPTDFSDTFSRREMDLLMVIA